MDYTTSPQLTSYSIVKDWMLSSKDQEQGKDVHYCHFYSTLYTANIIKQEEERSTSVIIYIEIRKKK